MIIIMMIILIVSGLIFHWTEPIMARRGETGDDIRRALDVVPFDALHFALHEHIYVMHETCRIGLRIHSQMLGAACDRCVSLVIMVSFSKEQSGNADLMMHHDHS